jgi:hypothetical protein
MDQSMGFDGSTGTDDDGRSKSGDILDRDLVVMEILFFALLS